MSTLTVGPRPPGPPPRRLQLGADAWRLLAEALDDVPLPPPFRAQDGPALDDAQRAAAEQALRDAGLLPGTSGDRLADLQPALRESLLVHAAAPVVVDASVGLGPDLRATRIALAGHLASALTREQRAAAGDAIELGPVQVSALLVDDVVAEILSALGALDGDPAREPLALDAAVTLAAVEALAAYKADVARAVLDGAHVPPPLEQLAAGLQAVARIDVASAAGLRVLVALRLDGGWWTAGMAGEDVVLRPVGEAELQTDLAAALAGAVLAGAMPAGASR